MASIGNRNTPVMVGPVPLSYVQKITINEGYKVERIEKTRFFQALKPTTKTITIEALLIGQGRMAIKKSLELIALVSRLAVSGLLSAVQYTGIPVVWELTTNLNMMVTDLTFTQGVDKRDALEVKITLQEIPRTNIAAILSEVVDVTLAAGSAGIPTTREPSTTQREVGASVQNP